MTGATVNLTVGVLCGLVLLGCSYMCFQEFNNFKKASGREYEEKEEKAMKQKARENTDLYNNIATAVCACITFTMVIRLVKGDKMGVELGGPSTMKAVVSTAMFGFYLFRSLNPAKLG